VVGLGQTEAADPLAGGEFGQVFLALGFGAEFKNRQHHQRGLHAHHRAVAGVDALDLAGDQTVAHVVQAGAAVLLGDGGTQQTQLAHLAEDRGVGVLVAESLQHTRGQLVLAIGLGGLADGALVVGQLGVEQQGVGPVECGLRGLGHQVSGFFEKRQR
jgi:hypothetical protein